MTWDWQPREELVAAVLSGAVEVALAGQRHPRARDGAPARNARRPPPGRCPVADPGAMSLALTEALADYLNHVRAERGLSANTVAAYRRDLNRYVGFLAGRGVTQVGDVTTVDITEFVGTCPSPGARLGRPPRGQRPRPARLSRRRVAHPRRPGSRGLPAEADATAAEGGAQRRRRHPDPRGAKSHERRRAPRRRALELLYGTGARVSEICSLDVDEISAALADPDAGLRLLEGARRVVPIGNYAAGAVSDATWCAPGRASREPRRDTIPRCCSTSAGAG